MVRSRLRRVPSGVRFIHKLDFIHKNFARMVRRRRCHGLDSHGLEGLAGWPWVDAPWIDNLLAFVELGQNQEVFRRGYLETWPCGEVRGSLPATGPDCLGWLTQWILRCGASLIHYRLAEGFMLITSHCLYR